MSPQFLQQCLGESLESLDLLLLTSQPAAGPAAVHAERMTEALHAAYPSCLGVPVVQALSEDGGDGIFGQRRWPLVVVLKPEISKPSLIRLLARLRDLHADRVVHLQAGQIDSATGSAASDDHTWRLADSLSLGFSRRGSLVDEVADGAANSRTEPDVNGGQRLNIFEFNLHTYKPAPDWLNSKHWAHPERWGKDFW